MSDNAQVDRMVEKALELKGLLPLEFLLTEFVPIDRLRARARERGLSPKGFRIDSAPARALAQAMLRDLQPELLAEAAGEIVTLLRARAEPAPHQPTPASPAPTPDALAEIDAELEKARVRLAATVAAQQKAEARVAELESRLALQAQQMARLRGDLETAERRGHAASLATPGRDVVRALHEAEAELEVLGRSESEYRLRLAEQHTAMHTQAQRIEELEAMLPKDRRKRKAAPPPPPPPPAERFRVPNFTSEFYRSLEGRDRRSVEAAFDAVFRFATAGYGYPGLEVKQLEGVNLWSMRAGIKVRVYFRPRADGFDILAVGDREDQDTLLRRLR